MKCNNEIECAERRLLIYSWLGVFSTIALIAYLFWGP